MANAETFSDFGAASTKGVEGDARKGAYYRVGRLYNHLFRACISRGKVGKKGGREPCVPGDGCFVSYHVSCISDNE